MCVCVCVCAFVRRVNRGYTPEFLPCNWGYTGDRGYPRFPLSAQTMQKRPLYVPRGTGVVYEVIAVLTVCVQVV